MTVDDLEIPPNTTIRQEYVNGGNLDCQKSHGLYLYTYWKQETEEKPLQDFAIRKIAKEIKLKPSQYTKFIS